jgi:nucleoside 2-deoxyribosyltransferase
MTSVYLAGPEVFLPGGRAIIERKRDMCRLFGLRPAELHGEFVTGTDDARSLGTTISLHNEKLMNEADVCIANLTPFRGPSADVGTVFELGYMIAQGKPAYGFTNDPRDYAERVAHTPGITVVAESGGLVTSDGEMVESHGMADNLMIEGGIVRRGYSLIRADSSAVDPWNDLTAFRRVLHLVATEAMAAR